MYLRHRTRINDWFTKEQSSKEDRNSNSSRAEALFDTMGTFHVENWGGETREEAITRLRKQLPSSPKLP